MDINIKEQTVDILNLTKEEAYAILIMTQAAMNHYNLCRNFLERQLPLKPEERAEEVTGKSDGDLVKELAEFNAIIKKGADLTIKLVAIIPTEILDDYEIPKG